MLCTCCTDKVNYYCVTYIYISLYIVYSVATHKPLNEITNQTWKM